MLGFVRNMKILYSEDLFWFQSYWSRDILHGNLRLLFGNSMVVIRALFTNLTSLCPICWKVCSPTVTYDWFPVNLVNRDGCHMWSRKCSLFPEHLISLPLGSSWFHPFINYIHYRICRSNYFYGLMTGLFAWISLDCFVVDLFDWVMIWRVGAFMISPIHYTLQKLSVLGY